VSLLATCNSPGKADGVVSLTVNGKTNTFKKIQWSEKKMKVAGLAFTSWFGGGSLRYAPSKTQKASFRNIRLTPK
jgi:arginine exporter protein ArgO